MLEVAMSLMAPEAAAAAYPVKTKRDKEAGISAYQTKDGILMVGAFTPDQNKRMWKMFEDQGYDVSATLKEPGDWEGLWSAGVHIKEALAIILIEKSAGEWQELFHNYQLPAEAQRTLDEAIEDPQLQRYFHHGAKEKGDSHAPMLPKAAYNFENGPAITSPPPAFGEHTDQILSSYGYSTEDLNEFRREGIIK